MYKIEKYARGLVITVKEDVDLGTAAQFSAEITRAASETSDLLVVSLLDCKFIDSTGLAVLVKAGKTFGKRFRVVVAHDSYLRRLFDATGLSKALNVDPTIDSALAADGVFD